MPSWLKKYLPFLILAVLLIAIVRNPDGTSHGAHHLMSSVVGVGDALGRFVSGLLSG
jgi:hypothetical protein